MPLEIAWKRIPPLKTCAFVMALALSLGLWACERTTDPSPAPGGEMSIGLVLPLTGHVAATGQLMRPGFDLALDEINPARQTRLNFILEDDASTAAGAIAAFNRLIEEGVSVILGPATSSATQAAFPIAQAHQVVAISPTSGASGLSAIGDFVFRIPLTTEVVIPIGIRMTQEILGYQRVATLYDKTDLFSTDRDRSLRETFAANGIQVLTTESFDSGDTTYMAQLTRIKDVDPDAIFVSALPPEKPLILIQKHRLGLQVPFFVSSLTDREVQAAGAAAEGAITFTGWLPTDTTPGNQAFVERFRATFDMEPTAFAALSYASVHILAWALEQAPSTDSLSIRDALAKLRGLDTILGSFSFDANGDAIYEPKVLIVKKGALQPFE